MAYPAVVRELRESSNTLLVDAGIATIKDMETLQAGVDYENANKRRVLILHRLKRRADEIRLEDE